MRNFLTILSINITFLKLETQIEISDQLLKQFDENKKKSTKKKHFRALFRTSSFSRIAGPVTFLLHDLVDIQLILEFKNNVGNFFHSVLKILKGRFP